MYIRKGDRIVWKTAKGFTRGYVKDAHTKSKGKPAVRVLYLDDGGGAVNYSSVYPLLEQIEFVICPQDGKGWVSQPGGRLSEHQYDFLADDQVVKTLVVRTCNSCDYEETFQL